MFAISRLSVINLFGSYSGLKINHEKTDVLPLPLGNKEVAVRNFELEGTEFKKTIKILGGHFTYNFSPFCKLHFDTIEKFPKKFAKGMGLERFSIDRKSANYKILYRLTLMSSKKDFVVDACIIIIHEVVTCEST